MKKCFRIILTVATLLALVTIGVSAANGCPGHDGGIAINSSNYNDCLKLQANTTYYLTEDMEKANFYYSGGGYYVFNVEGDNVTLCLNGYDIAPTQRTKGLDEDSNIIIDLDTPVTKGSFCGVRVAGTGFNLCNCQPAGGTIAGKAQRSLMLVAGSEATMTGNISLKSSLKLSGSTKSTTNIVQVNSGATFTMDGGSISGNEFLGTGASASNNVALLWNAGGTVNLNSGEICDNVIVGCADDVYVAPVVATSGTLNVGADFVVSGNTAQMQDGHSAAGMVGGILSYNSDTDVTPILNIGGTVSNNTGGDYGGLAVLGNVKATVTGTITGNKVTNNPIYGAQITINSYKSDTTIFTMTAGTVSAAGESANAMVIYRGNAAISGGTINGTVATLGVGQTVTLTISGGTFNGRLANKELPHPGAGLDAECTITLSGGRFSSETQPDKLTSWLANGKTLTPMTINGRIFYRLGSLSTNSCTCGHENALSGGTKIETDGTYYLSGTISGQIEVAQGVDVTLCLHGKNMTNSSAAAILCSGTLKIVNGSESGGNITSTGGACSVQVLDGGSLTMGDNVHIDGATSLTTAPVVVEADGSFTMDGGSISSNKFTASQDCAGGAICAAGDVTLNCGVISGNGLTVATGGYGGTVTMTGDTLTMGEQVIISGNTTKGHGGGVVLYGDSEFAMNGGTISGNTGNTGGGVAIATDDAVFHMSDGTISGNHAGRWGGGVAVRQGIFNLRGGLIKDNDLSNTYEYGNQVSVGLWAKNATGTFTMTGGEIVDTASDDSTEALTSTDVTIVCGTGNISGGTIIGDVGTVGASISEATLNISAGAIMGDVTNAVPLPLGATYTEEPQAEENARRACTINIVGGEFYGAVVETAHDSRPKDITNTIISGGKFSDKTELLSADGENGLKAWLDDSMLQSVMDISEGDLVYQVRPGLVYNGAYMEFGSSLDLGLNLVADVGVCTAVSGYTLTLSGADTDVEPEVLVKDVLGTPQLFVMAHGIAAKEMRDDITFTLKKDGEVWFTKTMSVYDAAKELGEGQNADYTAMLADMVHYGTQAQKRFSYNLRTLLTKPDLDGMSAGEVWTTGDVVVSDNNGSKVSLSLTLKEQIELNFYIHDSQAQITNVTFVGEAASASDYIINQATGEDDAYTLVSFREIPITKAKEIAEFTVTLSNGTSFDVSGGIASYVKLAQNDSTEGALIAAVRNYVDSVYNVFSTVPESLAIAPVSVEEL